ncbi:MAG: LacI family DNA-binding transcriptional regulator [Actinomycetaceae bacterium]|nr:LacI family DNA-binding transcriptional regulator [Actinomycetaceae bacterium]
MATAKKGKAPVISDVAKMAGVSVSTVSRYLNGSPHLKPETADRIARAIELLEYRPSAVARGLRKSAMKIIAVFATNTTLLGSAVTIEGVEAAASERGYSVIISKLDPEAPGNIERAVSTVIDLNPAGIVVLKYDKAALDALAQLPDNIPTVVIGGERDLQRDQVLLCEREGGYAVTEYLLALGHKTVHHVGVPVRSRETSRFDGWTQALWNAGAKVPEPLNSGWNAHEAIDLAQELVDQGATAVFAGNDEIAMGVIAGLTKLGKAVPGDISVAGFDNHPLGSIWNPGLTTYEQDFTGAGQEAVNLLISRLETKDEAPAPRLREVPGRLIVRESAQTI